jgi:hypothetical protein
VSITCLHDLVRTFSGSVDEILFSVVVDRL